METNRSLPDVGTKKENIFDRLERAIALPEDKGKQDRSYLVWCFLLPLAMLLLVYVLDGVFPFGNRSVLVLDLNGQYMGFFEALRDFVWGDGSMLYSFARTLGGEMMGIYAYYLASPLSYIVALFPREYITEAMLFIFVLKAGLSGLSFGYYIHRRRYASPFVTIAFSCLYALSSFAVVMHHNTMWMDCLILLPLLTLGLEELIRYRRFMLFVSSLSLSLLSNFYIGYMVCIYVLIYFFYYFYANGGRGVCNPLEEKNHYLRSLIRTGFYSLLAVGISAIIVMTVLYSLSFGKNTFTEPDFTPMLRFDPLAFFAKMMPGAYDTVRPEGLPIVFCGTLTLFLVPLYFLNRSFPRTERIVSFVLLMVFVGSMAISTLDMLWHGGQAPNWLNYRYAFILTFLLLVMGAKGFARLSDIAPKVLYTLSLSLLLLIGAAGMMGYEYFAIGALCFALIACLLYVGVLLLFRYFGKRLPSLLSLLLLVCVVVEVFANGVIQLAWLHADVGVSDRKDYTLYHKGTGETLAYMTGYDDSFYRMETTHHRVTNDVMEVGYRGLSNSTSTLNARTIAFLSRLGLLSTSHWSRYEGSTTVVDSLLGIKYLVTDVGDHTNLSYTHLLDRNQNSVWRNPYALPIAYATKDLTAFDFWDYGNDPLAAQNALIKAMTGLDLDVYTPLRVSSVDFQNGQKNNLYVSADECDYYEFLSDVYIKNRTELENGTMKDVYAPESEITFKLTVPADGKLYFYVPTNYKNKVTVLVNGLKIDTLFHDETDYVKDLGERKVGEEVVVTLRMDNCLYFYYPTEATLFYLENRENVASAMTALGENGITLSDFTESAFRGQIIVTEDKRTVLTTIPYDAGWQITVDGTPVTGYETLDALLAFDLAAGEHTVELVYLPDCYVIGRAVSIASLLLFLLLVAFEFCVKRGVIRLREGGLTRKCFDIFMNVDPIPQEGAPFSDEALGLFGEEIATKEEAECENAEVTAREGDAFADTESTTDTDNGTD